MEIPCKSADKVSCFFTVLIFFLFISSHVIGQISNVREQNRFYNDVVTGQDFVLYYELESHNGSFTLIIRDDDLNIQLSKEYLIGKEFFHVQYEVVDEMVYFLLSNQSNSKLLGVIDTKKLDVQFFPFSSIIEKIERFKIIGNTILVVQPLENEDLVQMYNYRTGILISLAELNNPKIKIWDVQVKDGIFDILAYHKGNFLSQSLKMIGYNPMGAKMYETNISPPDTSKLIFKSGKLFSSPETGYSIVGTFSRKKGEQFSGYYHVGINDFLEQKITIHPLKSLKGFFDYKKNPGQRKNAKHLRKDMVVHHFESNEKYIGLASKVPRLVKYFYHFILIDRDGLQVYDTSVRFNYEKLEQPYSRSSLALIDRDMYFKFAESVVIKALPDYKLYRLTDGNLTGIVKDDDNSTLKQNNSEWVDIEYYHWKDNKFIVLGIETIDGKSKYVIRQIEI
jgi:hypothetical protein